MSLQFQMCVLQHVLVVRLSGELDHHTGKKLREVVDDALAKGEISDVVFNMEELTFMDSSGLGVMLGRYRRITKNGGRLIFCSVQPAILRLMEMVGLCKLATLYDSERIAVASCEVAS
uniref:Anti-sigma F factor antagonist n=2 Tax=Pasteuria ramosa TaxID=225322 RepID=Q1KT22_9BACL|nr:SpoIIAA [Pasteuria ramosa]